VLIGAASFTALKKPVVYGKNKMEKLQGSDYLFFQFVIFLQFFFFEFLSEVAI
jgi:hypothetical protein